VPDRRSTEHPAGSGRAALAQAWQGEAFRRLLIATLLSGVAADIMLAFQVPIMRAAGLSLATAAAIAGARGFAKLLGRIPLGPLLRRTTARHALAAAQLTGTAAALLLLGAGIPMIAFVYALVAGAATGASSPLQGIYTAELVQPADLGLLLGIQQALYGIAGASGPIFVGVLHAATGSWIPAITLTAIGFTAAGILLLHNRPRPIVTPHPASASC
jgi:cyanate permease